jgi:hypothetical protein
MSIDISYVTHSITFIFSLYYLCLRVNYVPLTLQIKGVSGAYSYTQSLLLSRCVSVSVRVMFVSIYYKQVKYMRRKRESE